MRRERPTLFQWRHFEAEIIVLCVRWYLRYPLSFRQLEEILAERNLSVGHVTIWRWVQRYKPELNRRCRPELRNTLRALEKVDRRTGGIHRSIIAPEQIRTRFVSGCAGQHWNLPTGISG